MAACCSVCSGCRRGRGSQSHCHSIERRASDAAVSLCFGTLFASAAVFSKGPYSLSLQCADPRQVLRRRRLASNEGNCNPQRYLEHPNHQQHEAASVASAWTADWSELCRQRLEVLHFIGIKSMLKAKLADTV